MTRKSRPKNTKAGAYQLHKTIPGQNKSAEINEIRNTIRKTDNLTRNTRPPPTPYDPNAILGGDSDEDPYDYSDDEVVDDSRPSFLEEGYETDSSSQSLPWDTAPSWMQDSNQDAIYDYDSDIDAALDAEFDKLHPISLAPVIPPYASRSTQAPTKKDLDQVIHQANLYMSRPSHDDAPPLHHLSNNDELCLDPRSELAMSATVDFTACECECGTAAEAEDPPALPPSLTTSQQLHLDTEACLMSPHHTTLSYAPTAVTMTTLIPTVDPYLPNLSKLGHININDSPLTTDYWPEDLVQRHVDSTRPNSLYPPIMAWRPWMTLPPRRPDKRPPRRPRPMKPPNFISDYSLSANLRPCPVRPLKKPKPSRKGTSIPKLKVRGKPTLPCSGCPPWTRRKDSHTTPNVDTPRIEFLNAY